MTLLALDIGGANLKMADGIGHVESRYFPLWQRPEQLAAELEAMLRAAPAADQIVATMTGELADCYRTKAEGVARIVEALATAAVGRQVRIYSTDGTFIAPQDATNSPLKVAAANWHALARFAGRFAPSGPALLLDIGSTTSDLIPLIDGQPAPRGWTDPDRLLCGELVYTGVQRSNLCVVCATLPWRGASYPTANELFTTTWDAYLMLDALPEEPYETYTADGRAATKEFAHERLARAICADRDQFTRDDALAAAHAVEEAQLAQLARAAQGVIDHLPGAPQTVVVSGRGEFLARKLIERLQLAPQVVSLGDELGPQSSRCATAHALAVLAREAD